MAADAQSYGSITRVRSRRARLTAVLLRHLKHAERLADHPFVALAIAREADNLEPSARLRSAISAVRVAAWAAVDDLGSLHERGARLRTIIAQCDMSGVPHKVVAAQLALSRSEFYRELAGARLAVEGAILRKLESRTRIDSLSSSAVASRIRAAHAIHLAGNGPGAMALLRPLLEDGSGQNSLDVLDALVDIASNSDLLAEAQRYVKDAEIVARRLGTKAALAQLWLLRARLEYQATGDQARTDSLLADAARTLSDDTAHSALNANLVSEVANFQMHRAHLRGEFGFGRTLADANPARFAATTISEKTYAAFLVKHTLIQRASDLGPLSMVMEARKSYEYSASHGFQRYVVSSLRDLAVASHIRGCFDQAVLYGTEAVELSRVANDSGDHASVCSTVATLLLDSGRGKVARALANEAKRALTPRGSDAWLASSITEAQCANVEGHPNQALALCAEIETEAERGGKLLLAALCKARAIALGMLGRVDLAYRLTMRAEELLSDGPADSRVQILTLAQRFRPSRSRALEIAALQHLLRSGASATWRS